MPPYPAEQLQAWVFGSQTPLPEQLYGQMYAEKLCQYSVWSSVSALLHRSQNTNTHPKNMRLVQQTPLLAGMDVQPLLQRTYTFPTTSLPGILKGAILGGQQEKGKEVLLAALNK